MPRKTDHPDDWMPESGRDRQRVSKEISRGVRTGTKRSKKSAKGVKLRIIGGDMRGRSVPYHGADFTRPMQDKLRESLFNILGRRVKGTQAIDLFGGTGVLGIESISRGASSAVVVEQNTRAADVIRSSGAALDLQTRLTVITGDAFRIGPELICGPGICEDELPTPKVIYFCPPYRLWVEAADRMLSLVRTAIDYCPLGSVLVTESDRDFDPTLLPGKNWDLRRYGSTILGFYEPAQVCGGDL